MIMEILEKRLEDGGFKYVRENNVIFLDKELFLGTEASVMNYDGQLILSANGFNRVVNLEKLLLILSLLSQLK